MDAEPLITKVGAIVLREAGEGYEVLAIQPRPKAKSPDDLPPIGLVRGTRSYFDTSTNTLIDADHNGRTAPPEGMVLEPLAHTLAREIEEEGGVTAAMLANAQVREMGARLFASAKKIPYPIYWYVVLLQDSDAEALPLEGLQDSLHSEWVSLAKFVQYVEAGKASRGYIPVIEEALNVCA